MKWDLGYGDNQMLCIWSTQYASLCWPWVVQRDIEEEMLQYSVPEKLRHLYIDMVPKLKNI